MELIIRAPLYDPSGYSYVARKLTIALMRQGINVKALHMENRKTKVPLTPEELKLLEIAEHTTVVGNPPLLNICIANQAKIDKEKFSMLLTMLESDRIIEKWARVCNNMDLVFVPSNFNKESFSNSGVYPNKLNVLPLGVDTEVFNPEPTKLDKDVREAHLPDFITDDTYIFFSNFEWIERKNGNMLLDAYCDMFSPEEDVVLLLKIYRSGLDSNTFIKNIQDKIKLYLKDIGKDEKHPKIIVLPTFLTEKEMAALYRLSDCYVTPTSGEGWCLPIVEAMATKKPVIATNWSAYLDYLNNKNGYLIDVEELIDFPGSDEPLSVLYEGSKWAKPDVESLKKLMRHVYENREEAEEKAESGYNYVTHHLTWTHMGNKVMNLLSQLSNIFQTPARIPIEVDEKLKVGMVVPTLGKRLHGINEYAYKLKEGIGDKADVILVPNVLTNESFEKVRDCNIINYQYEYDLYNINMFRREALNLRDKAISVTMHLITPGRWKDNYYISKYANQILVQNQEMRQFIMEKISNIPVLVVPRGCPTSCVEFEPAEDCQTNLHLGTLGFAFNYKNFQLLILSVAILNDMGISTKLTMISNVMEDISYSQNYEKYLDYLIEHHEIKHIDWIKELLPERAIIQKLHECDLIVLPYIEPDKIIKSSIAVRTAMSALRPVVVTDVPFFTDVRDDTIMVSSQISTPGNFANVLLNIGKNIQLRDEAQRKVEQFVKKNSWESIGERHVQVWTKLLENMKK